MSNAYRRAKKVDEVHRAYGLVVLPNPGSEKLHEKLGFQVAGLLHEGGYKFENIMMFECMSTGWGNKSFSSILTLTLYPVIMERIHRRAPPAHNH